MKKYFLIVFLAIFSSTAWSATYYVDYATGDDERTGSTAQTITTPWATAPGMAATKGSVARGAYSAADDDVFVFKGGVTWPAACFPFTLASGSSGNIKTYTGGQLDGTPWGTGYPVFDAETTIGSTATGIVVVTSKQYWRLNGIKLINSGTSGVLGGGHVIYANHTNAAIEQGIIENCYLEGYNRGGIYIAYNPTSPISQGIIVRNNYITKATNSIQICVNVGGGTEIVDNVQVYGNKFFDGASQLVSGDHGDGIHFWCKQGTSVFDNLLIYDNQFYGDWEPGDSSTAMTAFIYLEGALVNGKIYNNHMTFSNSDYTFEGYFMSPGFITVGGGTTLMVANNSISATAMTGSSGSTGAASGIRMGNVTTLTMKNNIVTGCRFGISFETNMDGATLYSDYNDVQPRAADGYFAARDGGTNYSLASWQSAKSTDANSAETFSGWASDDGTASALRLSASIPGESLSETFTTDLLLTTRSAFDIGAYEYEAGEPPVQGGPSSFTGGGAGSIPGGGSSSILGSP